MNDIMHMEVDINIIDTLLTYIDENEIDFIARCSTPWHLTAIEAYICKSFPDKKAKGLFVFYPRDDKYLLKKKDIMLPNNIIYDAINAKGYDTKTKIWQSICIANNRKITSKTMGKDIHVIAPDSGWYFLIYRLPEQQYHPISVIIEDGFAHYNSRKIWIQEARSFRQKILTLLQFKMIDIVRQRVNCDEIYFTLFDKKNKMKPNREVIESFKKCLLNNENLEVNSKMNYNILFLSQPLVEDGHINEDDMRGFYEALIEAYNSCLRIKVHPRDSFIRKLGFLNDYILEDNGLNAEQYYSNLTSKPDVVVGFHSTSLVTLKLFYDANVISMNHILYKYLTGNYIINSFRNFENLFSGQVIFIDEIRQLDQYLNKYHG